MTPEPRTRARASAGLGGATALSLVTRNTTGAFTLAPGTRKEGIRTSRASCRGTGSERWAGFVISHVTCPGATLWTTGSPWKARPATEASSHHCPCCGQPRSQVHEKDGQGLSNCPSHLFSPARGTLGLLQTRQNRTPTHCPFINSLSLQVLRNACIACAHMHTRAKGVSCHMSTRLSQVGTARPGTEHNSGKP